MYNKKENSKRPRYKKVLSMFLASLMIITILPQSNVSAYGMDMDEDIAMEEITESDDYDTDLAQDSSEKLDEEEDLIGGEEEIRDESNEETEVIDKLEKKQDESDEEDEAIEKIEAMDEVMGEGETFDEPEVGIFIEGKDIYSNLNDAFDAAGDGDTIIIKNMEDIVLDSNIFLNPSSDINIKLKGVFTDDSAKDVTIVMSEEKSGWRIFNILTSHKFELTFENIILDGKGKSRGIYLHGGGDFVIDGAMIQNCQTWEHNEFDYFGAAICISGANSVIIRNSGLIDNSSYSFGGAIGSIFTDNIVIENCRIIGNKAGPDSDGGAIYVSSGNSVNVVITESWIDNNSAKNSGGIHVHSVYDGEVSITDSTISNNKAASNGGGIGISSNISLEVDKTKISGNEAENGGGIYGKTGSEIIIKNDSIISSNEAINNGGGISIGELENLYIDEDVEFSNNKAGKEAGGILEEHIPIHDKNIKTDTRSIETEYLYNNYDVGYDMYKVELYIDHELKGTLNVQNGHSIEGKIPEEIASLVDGDWYKDENYYYEFYMNISITENTKIYARGKKVPLVCYEVNYLEKGTDKPLADKVTKSGALGKVITEKAIDISGYNKTDPIEKTIILKEEDNVINFYYTKYDVIKGSNFYDIKWKYETGYNTGKYDERYHIDGEGSPKEIKYYIDLHYDSNYKYTTHTIKTEERKVEVSSGSASTGTAIKTETTTFIELFYDRKSSGNGGGGGNKSKPKPDPKPSTIKPEEPKEPSVNLEKNDHFAYVIGYPDGNVKPLNKITREEVTMIFYRLLTDESRNKLLSNANTFMDLAGHDWSNRAISTLFNAGIISGYPDGTFKPSAPITRAEFATIAAKFDKLKLENTTKFTDIKGHWAEKYITSSENKGWIKGYPDKTFKPEQDITRAEAMTLINNVLERAVTTENIHPDAIFWPDMEKGDWYYEAVMEATNSHDYIYEKDDELWTGMKANKVWP